MRISAIRFGDDLWQLVEAEARRTGISVSQYIREAALARATASAAARGEDPFELLARPTPQRAAASDTPASASLKPSHPLHQRARAARNTANATSQTAQTHSDTATAVGELSRGAKAEAQQAKRQANKLRGAQRGPG